MYDDEWTGSTTEAGLDSMVPWIESQHYAARRQNDSHKTGVGLDGHEALVQYTIICNIRDVTSHDFAIVLLLIWRVTPRCDAP